MSACGCHEPAVFGHVKCIENALKERELERRKRERMRLEAQRNGSPPARISITECAVTVVTNAVKRSSHARSNHC